MLTVQQILNELYGTGNLSVQQILNKVYEAGGFADPPADMVVYVGAGESLQEAADAAAANATDAVPKFIQSAAESVWDLVALPENVYVLPPIQLSASSHHSRFSGIQGAAAEPVYLPFGTPMVAFHSDDGVADSGSAGWFRAQAALGGLTPAQYAARKHVIFSHGIIPSLVGTAGYMTIAQIRALNMQAGSEILNQSYTHGGGALPLDTIDAYRETVAAREWLEAMASATWSTDIAACETGAANDAICERLGLKINGFSIPGGFMGMNPAKNFGKSKLDSATLLHQMIAATHSFSIGYFDRVRNGAFGNDVPHLGIGETVADIQDNTFNVDTMLAPNTRYLFVFDAPTDAKIATWKANVDAFAAARNAGKLMIVNVSALVLGVQLGGYSADHAENALGGIPGGDLAGVADGAYPIGDVNYRLTSSNAAIVKADGLLTVPSDRTISSAQYRRPGTYTFRVKASTAAAGKLEVFVTHLSAEDPGKTLYLYLTPAGYETLDGTQRDYYYGFGVPDWAMSTRINVRAKNGTVLIGRQECWASSKLG